jgi:hypothetical protein
MDDLTAVLWRDKHDVYILTNLHDAPAEGNFYNMNGKAIKPQTVVEYSHHVGYVDKGDWMANSYSIGHRTWKWTKKLFFHLLDLALLNIFILLSSCGSKKISHRDFQFFLMRNMLAHDGQDRDIPGPLGRPRTVDTQVSGSKHWPTLPSSYAVPCVWRTFLVKCSKCDVDLCVVRR